jgi:hypothetical protein
VIKKDTYTKYVKYSNCRLDIEVYKTRQHHGDREKEVNLRARKLGTLPDHFLHSVQKVSLRSDLSAGTDGKHASLFKVNYGFRSITNDHTSVATDRSSAPVVLGHNLAIKSKRISLSTLMLEIQNKRNKNALETEYKPSRVYPQNMCATFIVRQRKLDSSVNSPRSQQCRVKSIWSTKKRHQKTK